MSGRTSRNAGKGTVATAAGMKAIILDGDCSKQSSDWAEVATAHAEGRRFWVEIDERTPEADRFLDEILKVHPLAVEDIWNDLGLPKVEDFTDYVQIVMHGVREEDVGGSDIPLALTELDIIIGRNFIVTHAHDEEVCAVAPVQAEVARNAKLLKKGPAWIAHALLDRMVDEYLPVVDRFDDQIEELEQQILTGKGHQHEHRTMKRIMRIKRSLQMLRRTTIYQQEILHRLARAEFDEIPREAVPFYRDVYDHFTRVTELVDSYRELATGLLEVHFSVQSQQMNEIMKRLTLVSTIMLPLTFIAGVYGMNFERMPELKWAYGYPFAITLMVGISIGIIAYFRRKHLL